MPNLNCDEDITDLLALINPILAPDFLNPTYDATQWAGWDQGAYTISFYYNGTQITDFSKWYVGKSMRIRKVNGFEPGDASFMLWDYGQYAYNQPFEIPGQMELRIANYNDTETYFRGRVQDVQYQHKSRRDDGTENRTMKVACLDLKGDFKRILFSETYPAGVTTYGVIKDVIQHKMPHTRFDASGIDAAKGFVLTGYRVFERYAADVIQEMLDLEVTTTFKFDLNTLAVTLGQVTDPTFNFLNVTEQNVYTYFKMKDFFIARQNQILRNKVIFWFNAAYATGTIGVTNGVYTVIGTGTLFKSNVRAGADFVVSGDNSKYTVEEVVSDTDLRLSSPVQRTTASGLTYSVSSYRDRVVVDDATNIASLAAILSSPTAPYVDSGVFMVKMPERPNPLTRAQARTMAQAYVNRMAGKLILRGQAISDNCMISTANIDGGDSIDFNLATSRKLQANVQLQALTLEDIDGSHMNRSDDPTRIWHTNTLDTRIDPHHKMTFDFTDRRLKDDLVMERTLQDLRDVRIADDEILETVASALEYMLLADCVGVVTNIGPNGNAQGHDNTVIPAEVIQITDSAAYASVDPSQLYYAAPVNVGQNEAYAASSTTVYSFAN